MSHYYVPIGFGDSPQESSDQCGMQASTRPKTANRVSLATSTRARVLERRSVFIFRAALANQKLASLFLHRAACLIALFCTAWHGRAN